MQLCRNFLIWGALALLLWNCQGEDGLPGPPGPRGPAGPPGPQTLSLMYEVPFTLDEANDWLVYYAFPPEDEIYPEDVVLVYLLWDVVETDDGGTVDVWRLMPVNFFDERGLLQINYDFSVSDVAIFAEASFPLDPDKDTFEDFLARIVIVPADYSPNATNARKHSTIDYENYEEVKEVFGLPDIPRTQGTPFMEIMRQHEAGK